MESHINKPLPPDEIQVDPSTEKKLRRSLLFIALAGLLAPCGFCWFSSQVETIELVLIPVVLGLIVLFYTLYTFYQRQQRQDLAPPLWRVGTVFLALLISTGLALLWLLRVVGWQTPSGLLIAGLGIWSLFLAGRRVWESWKFSRQAVVEEARDVELDMISIRGSHPIYPELVYRYAGGYRGRLRSDRIHRLAAEIRKAIENSRFTVVVKYLPEDPRVHRLENWRIEN